MKALTCVLTLYAGYYLGRHFNSSDGEDDFDSETAEQKELVGDQNLQELDPAEENAEELADGDLSAISASVWEPCKLVSTLPFTSWRRTYYHSRFLLLGPISVCRRVIFPYSEHPVRNYFLLGTLTRCIDARE